MKKGQLYILTSLILIVIIYGMVTIANQTSQESITNDFKKLSNNYANEGSRLINAVMKDGGDPITVVNTFRDFTRSYTSYLKTQSADFGLIYVFYYTGIYPDKGYLYIGNYLNMPMLVSYDKENYAFIDGCYEEIPVGIGYDGISLDLRPDALDVEKCEIQLPSGDAISINKVYVTIGGYGYTFEVKPGQPEIVIVSREDTPEQRQVFVGGSFVPTTENTVLFSDYCESDTSLPGNECDEGTICPTAYLTKDDCERDNACTWDNPNKICKNVE
ncbi:MAG: hypothetical protein V1914_03830 [archaeon]